MSKKLSEKELQLLNSYQTKNNDIIFSLGSIELNKMVQNEKKEELFKNFKETKKYLDTEKELCPDSFLNESNIRFFYSKMERQILICGCIKWIKSKVLFENIDLNCQIRPLMR